MIASMRPDRLSASSIRSGRFDAPKNTTRPRLAGSPRNWSSMLKRFLATGLPEALPRALTSDWSSSSMNTRHGARLLTTARARARLRSDWPTMPPRMFCMLRATALKPISRARPLTK